MVGLFLIHSFMKLKFMLRKVKTMNMLMETYKRNSDYQKLPRFFKFWMNKTLRDPASSYLKGQAADRYYLYSVKSRIFAVFSGLRDDKINEIKAQRFQERREMQLKSFFFESLKQKLRVRRLVQKREWRIREDIFYHWKE